MNLSSTIYMPQLKWKFGELRAIGSAVGGASRLLPLFKIPPAGAFDQAEGRVLGAAEYIRSFGTKLANNWSGGVIFVDGHWIDDDRHSNAVGQHALTELLERARLAHVMACPVVSITSSSAYQEAVRRFRRHNRGWPICLRVTLAETDIFATRERLDAILNQLGGTPSETVLLIDAGPIFVPDIGELVNIIIETLAPLSSREPFARLFWSSTTFPEQHGLKAGEMARWPRTDWLVYRRLVERANELNQLPLFSDYALEYPAYYKPIRASPTAHLRYSSEADYLMVRGSSTKKPHGYQAIFPVAAQLIDMPEFKGESYSVGNSYIKNLANALGKTGHAGMWRWASTDHHLTMVLQGLSQLMNVPLEIRVEPSPAVQMELI